jgi:outer membrane lipoprotein SlyB
MVKRLTLLLLGSLIITLPGCAGSRSPSASAGPADVNGTWMGDTVAGTRGITIQLRQTGNNVTGTLAGAGVADGPISGVIGGDTLQLSAERAAFAPRLVVRGDLMNGELDGIPMNLVRLGSPTQSSR